MQFLAAASGGDVATVRRRHLTVCREGAARHGPATTTIRHVSAADLGPSWHPGCPVEPRHLRRVDVNYIGFDGQTHRGDVIVHEDLASEVVAIFEQLRQLRYPIEKIRTADTYPGADDELSMEDNNTSAFNCRDIPGTGRWSQHAFGRAIDLNPLLNPSIDQTGAFQPKDAAPYLDRNRTDPRSPARGRSCRARLHRSRLALGW